MRLVDGWVWSQYDFVQDGAGAVLDVRGRQALDHDSVVLVRAYVIPRAVSVCLSTLSRAFLVLVPVLLFPELLSPALG